MEETTQPPQQAPRRLTRVNDGRMIGGVANGIAHYFDIDPWLVRAAFVVLTIFGGSGIIVYVLGLLTLPREDDPPGTSPIERLLHGSNVWPVVGAVVVVVLVFNGLFHEHGFFYLPLLLILGGIYLFRDRWEPAVSTPAAATASVDTEVLPSTPVTTAAYGQAPSRRSHRRRSPLGMLTIGAAILAFGVTIALTQSGAVHLRVQQVLAIPMVVLGLGILVGTFFGRARLLIIPALLLLPCILAAGIANVPFHSSAGSQTYRPTSAAELEPVYRLGAGRMVVDLSKVGSDSEHAVNVSQGAGLMVVIVPKNQPTSIDASNGAGVIDMLGRTTNGFQPHLSTTTPGEGQQLNITLRNGFGRTLVTDNPNVEEAK